MNKDDIINLATACSKDSQINANLVLGLIYVESNFYPYAFRFESHWIDEYLVKGFANRNHITETSERILQCSSIGLMQLMGSNARRLGFADSLLQMCDPQTALLYGLKHLKLITMRYPIIDDQISAYNAGSPIKNDGEYVNQDYVNQVLVAMSRKAWLGD